MAFIKLHKCLQSILSVYCVCIGVTSYYYDYHTGQYIQNKFTKYYSAVVNIISVITTPVVLYYAYWIVDSFPFNLMTQYTNYVNLTTRALAVIYTSFFRWLREHQHLKLIDELIQVDPDFTSYKISNEDVNMRLRYIYCMKFAAFCYQCFVSLTCFIWLEHLRTWQKWVITVISTNVLNILACTMFNYFLFMWWMCLSYQQLNAKLTKLLAMSSTGNESEVDAKEKLLELEQLSRIHWHLTNAVQIIARVSQFQLLANICASTVTNIVNGYYGITFLFLMDEPPKWWLIVMGGSSYMMIFIDMYLMDIMCDDVIQRYKKTSQILQRSCEMSLQKDVQKICEQFSLQLVARKLTINLCGLFNIDKMNTFDIIVQTIFYVILLIQFDFILKAGQKYG